MSLALTFVAAVAAAQAKPAANASLDQRFKELLPVCQTAPKISVHPFEGKLPDGMKGDLVDVQGDSVYCQGEYMAITTRSGSYFLGAPWPIEGVSGSVEQKIAQFAYDRMGGEIFSATVGKTPTPEGLLPVNLVHTTDYGNVPMEAWIDPAGNMLFLAPFYRPGTDALADRISRIEKVAAHSPTLGPADAPVRIYEFSDFECPSCKHADPFIRPLIDKYKGQVRFTRIDFPLISSHPWAFPAAMMARAIFHQSPDAFWAFEKEVYEKQADLNIFVLEDFAKGFVSDHGLDVAKFNQDRNSEATRNEILEGVGLGYAIQLAGTPTFVVNGKFVVAGKEGDNLDRYVGDLLAKK